MTTTDGMIFGKLAAALKAMKGVEKGGRNESQGFNFRSIDAIAAAAKVVFEEQGIFVAPSMRLVENVPQPDGKGYRAVIEAAYTFYAEDGSSVTACTVGEGVDSYDKATNKAMAAAFKYLLMQTLCIADPADDSDAHSEPPPEQRRAPAVPSTPAPPPEILDESTLEVTAEQWKVWEKLRPTLLDDGPIQEALVTWLQDNGIKADRRMPAAMFAALMAKSSSLANPEPEQ